MSDEEVDAAMAQPLPWTAPKTVGDLLTLVFAEDWNARKTAMEAVNGQEFNCSVWLRYKLQNADVARAHLLRMMEAERQQREQG